MNAKNLNNLIANLFIYAGFILLLGEKVWFPDFYNPVFMGTMSLVCAALIWLPRFILNPKNEKQEKVLDLLQTGLAFTLIIGSLGSLGLFQLYKIGIQYDKMVHFLNSFIFTAILVKLLVDWVGISLKKALIVAILVVSLGGVLWEGFEFWGDYMFGTQMLGHYGEFITEDTNLDLLMNSLGIILAICGFKILR